MWVIGISQSIHWTNTETTCVERELKKISYLKSQKIIVT